MYTFDIKLSIFHLITPLWFKERNLLRDTKNYCGRQQKQNTSDLIKESRGISDLFIGCKHLRGLYRGLRDTGYLPFYFQGYRIPSILLPGIWDTVFNSLVTFRDIDYLRKLIMRIFANL